MITLSGKLNNYNKLESSKIEIDKVSTEYHNIYHSMTIKQIYVHDVTEDWYGLELVLNRYVEDNSLKFPLEATASQQPFRSNLLNPIVDAQYDDNKHVYRTPYKDIDTFGIVNKKNEDNVKRTQDTIDRYVREKRGDGA